MDSLSTLELKKQIRGLLLTPRKSLSHDLEISAQIDELLGLDVASCEKTIVKESIPSSSRMIENDWIGLSPEALQTGYLELTQFVKLIGDHDAKAKHISSGSNTSTRTWIDLGCAYARLGIVVSILNSTHEFIGVESVEKRLEAAKKAFLKLGFPTEQLLFQRAEELNFKALARIPDIYFMYDFGTREKVNALLEALKDLSQTKSIIVVARGRGTQHWIDREHPWLSQVNTPVRLESSSVYFS